MQWFVTIRSGFILYTELTNGNGDVKGKEGTAWRKNVCGGGWDNTPPPAVAGLNKVIFERWRDQKEDKRGDFFFWGGGSGGGWGCGEMEDKVVDGGKVFDGGIGGVRGGGLIRDDVGAFNSGCGEIEFGERFGCEDVVEEVAELLVFELLFKSGGVIGCEDIETIDGAVESHECGAELRDVQ
ncbi:hypothetical protein KS4_06710 [Poriferisphaera corsica]|uniref:Uncharacterized protein n=1 Tax=Poriferisphaera corsica TaxID=2528020 RepID=A0A517YQZ5_9BACT|nr:hypothetical protein KS4_06710 [Poriferisphaera corsica]